MKRTIGEENATYLAVRRGRNSQDESAVTGGFSAWGGGSARYRGRIVTSPIPCESSNEVLKALNSEGWDRRKKRMDVNLSVKKNLAVR